MNTPVEHPYFILFKGRFTGVLRWEQLDNLWEKVLASDEGWYIYSVGDTPPEKILSKEELNKLIPELDTLLRKDHGEDYCGIVYINDKENPSFIKVFDPNNLGSSCSMSNILPLPSWIISTLKPINLPDAMPQTAQRKRWWQKVFS